MRNTSNSSLLQHRLSSWTNLNVLELRQLNIFNVNKYVRLAAVVAASVAELSRFKRFILNADQEIKLENLRPSTRYILHIGAKNDVGVGTLIEFSITTDNVSKWTTVVFSPHLHRTGWPQSVASVFCFIFGTFPQYIVSITSVNFIFINRGK